MNDIIQKALDHTITDISFSGGNHIQGKVRESFAFSDTRAIVVTDRISAFDFILGTVPFKGQVLNQIAAWWFKKIDTKIPHHLISTPDPNVSLVKNANVLPIEIIVRGYLTGTTKTSAWYAYQNLDRMICGIEMPAGMKKNEKFSAPIITPTTKPLPGSGEHDVPISKEEIISQGLVEKSIYEKAEQYGLEMFAIGQEIAAKQGLILVDTKYEMGLDEDGNLMVIDEIHTPDSSRYWIADTYEKNLSEGKEPDMLDKEFVRRMIVGAGYDVDDESQDPSTFMTDEMRILASQKYIELFERITGEAFIFPEDIKAEERIVNALKKIAEDRETGL